jgi:XTP/dITP diphosphohydrolase
VPALARADTVLGKLSRAGLRDQVVADGGRVGAPADDTAGDAPRSWDETAVGGTLLDVVDRARGAGIDAEAALRGSVRRLEAAARQVEREARAR